MLSEGKSIRCVNIYMSLTYSSTKVNPDKLKGSDASKLLNNYTLTMDVYLDRLPDNPLSLYQTQGNSGMYYYDDSYMLAFS